MGLVRLTVRLSLLVLIIAGAAAVGAWFLAFDPAPSIDRRAQLTPEHIERAQAILRNNDPRRMRSGTVRTMPLSAADVDTAVSYLAERYAGGSAGVTFATDRVVIRASIRAGALPGKPYINIESELIEGETLPEIRQVRVGQLPVPAALARWIVGQALGLSVSRDDLDMVAKAVRRVAFDESGATVTYEWDSDIIDRVRAALVSPAERARLRVYQEALAEVIETVGNPVSLVQLLQPLFAMARDRSREEDPVAENRAAILVLTLYVDGRSPRDIVPDSRNWRRPARRSVRLSGRHDLAQHFTVSATLSANTGGPFSDAVGIYKEVLDSRGGSGFSFDDVAADRAGSRLGTMAETPASARVVQERLSSAASEAFIMPAIADLPAGLTDAEFRRQFGGVGGTRYEQTLADIDRRVAALALFRR